MLIQGYYPEVGGAERQLASLAPRLRDRNLSVTVYARHKPGLPALEHIEGVPVHRLGATGPKAARSLSYTVAVLRHLQRDPPDVIHAHDLFSPTTTALLARRLLRVPVAVKVVRGGSLGDLRWLERRNFGRQRVSWICQKVDRFVVISEEINEELAARGVVKQRRALIPNGVDCERFFPIEAGEKAALREQLGLPAGPIVVYAGRLAREKRVEDLVTVWPAIREHDPLATLLVVGTGEQESFLRRAGTDGVVFTGAVADVAPYLRAADIFALPSVAEGLSNALLEAMASGLACIATDVGAAPELITSGHSGLLIAPESPQVLKQQIMTLLDDPVLREALGSRARMHVGEYFSLESVAGKLERLYHELVRSD